MEDCTEFCEPTLTLTLTLSEYARLHRGFAHYKNFFMKNSCTESDFAVLQEIAELQASLNNQVNTQLGTQLTEWNKG